MIEILKLFLTFLKIGAVAFGGGYGMIPLITEEVLKNSWMTEGELLNFIAISESTPGPIAVNMATFIGSQQGYAIFGTMAGRLLGSVLATLGVVLPAFAIVIVILALIKKLLKFKGVQAFLDGVRPVVIGLIVTTGLLMLVKVVLNVTNIYSELSFDYKSLIIFAVVCLIYILYRVFSKKKLSPILSILISGVLGVVVYGFF